MKINITSTVTAVSFILGIGMLPGLSVGTNQARAEERNVELQRSLNQIATDSVADSLKACLARIPSDASAGQTLLAADTCKQEAALRNLTNLTF
jgi:hypothetical protein